MSHSKRLQNSIVKVASGLAWSLVAITLAWILITVVMKEQKVDSEVKPTDPSPQVAGGEGNSASEGFIIGEIDKFRPGRPMADILRDIHWVGNFEMAAEQDGKDLAVISFYVHPKVERYGKTLWAVFVANRFVKFVEMDPKNVSYPIPIGTFQAIQICAKLPPVVVADFKQRMEEDNRPEPNDPALAAIYAKTKTPEVLAFDRHQQEENTQLRDQFNSARLKIGMTKAEVAATLRARPLESGALDSGSFEIYGSTKIKLFNQARHYKNVLVVYRGDRLAVIYSGLSALGGQVGLNSLRKPLPDVGLPQGFVGLPPVQAKAN